MEKREISLITQSIAASAGHLEREGNTKVISKQNSSNFPDDLDREDEDVKTNLNLHVLIVAFFTELARFSSIKAICWASSHPTMLVLSLARRD